MEERKRRKKKKVNDNCNWVDIYNWLLLFNCSGDEKSTAKSEASKVKEESTKPEPVKSNHYNDVNVII